MIVGYAYVVGDILHTGHLLHLRNCKAMCDKLIVGVLTEAACMERKPAPTLPLRERLELVRALKCVDVAVAQDTYSPAANVNALKVDILFESTSHEGIPEVACRVMRMPYYPETSSTAIKAQIRCGNCGNG